LTGDRNDPYRQFRFRIEIGGIARAGFQKVTFSDAAAAVTEFHEESRFKALQKLPGLDRHGNISFRHGITDSLDLYDWHKKAIESGAAAVKKNMSIIQTDEAGAEVARWEIVNAWPAKYIHSGFGAKGTETAIDSMEIVCEGYTRVR
jgi:phage tail-like protein